jgi:hypothetical protein
MSNHVIVPILKGRNKNKPEILNETSFAMGLMAVCYYKDFKKYFSLFLDKLINSNYKKGNSYFNEGTMRSLFIFFDLIIVNDLSIEEDDEM